MKKLMAWNSTPLVNVVRAGDVDLLQLSQEMLDVSWFRSPVAKREGSVEFHKRVLGRQHYTWVGEYRFWIWEGDNWRVFASNIHGTSFEVREKLSPLEAMAAWNDYLGRIGFKCGRLGRHRRLS